MAAPGTAGDGDDRIPADLRERFASSAARAAAAAPPIRGGDDVALRLQNLFADLPEQLAARPATKPSTAA